MRFFKLFLVCFFSLIGVVGGIVGVEYLVGALNEKKVEATEIHFEQENYYVDGDFSIKITSKTEDVTATKITLTLPDSHEITENNIKYLSNEQITIPQTVYLNKSFEVIVNKEKIEGQEGQDWITGGNTTITARSESLQSNDAKTDIWIDVPIYSISLNTYLYKPQTSSYDSQTSSYDSQPFDNSQPFDSTKSFAVGETFVVEAKCYPEKSKYKYSKEGLYKKIYFDASTNPDYKNLLEENLSVLKEEELPYKTAYKVLKSSEIKIDAYAFSKASLEDKAMEVIKNNQGINPLQLVSSPEYGGIGKEEKIEFKDDNITFTIDEESHAVKKLEYNKETTIYANFKDPRSQSFGIEISNSILKPLKSKIADVGIRPLLMSGNGTDEEVVQDISQYILFSDYGKVAEYDNKKYYFPKFNPNNADLSYWKVVSLLSNADLSFELRLFKVEKTGIEPIAEIKPITCYNNGQFWQSESEIETTYEWTTTEDQDLIIIDSLQTDKIVNASLDLKKLVKKKSNGTYQTEKFFAFSDPDDGEDLDLIDYLDNVTLTKDYVIPQAADHKLYLINDGTLSVKKECTFEVIAVILKTDYEGKLIRTEENGPYEIYRIINNGSLTINVTKTLKSLTASISVSNLDLLKNKNDSGNLNVLAFVGNSSRHVFDIVLTIKLQKGPEITDDWYMFHKEMELFKQAYEDGSIQLDLDGGENLNIEKLESSAIEVPESINESVTNTDDYLSWSIKIPVSTRNVSSTSKVRIKYTYQKTEMTKLENFINEVVFEPNPDGVSYDPDADFVNIEVYDGLTRYVEFKIKSVESPYHNNDEFKYDNSEEYPVQEQIEITEGEVAGDIVFANAIKTSYKANIINKATNLKEEKLVTDQIVDATNNYLFVFYDKYKNKINDEVSPSDYNIIRPDGNKGNKIVVSMVNKSSDAQVVEDTLYLSMSDNIQGNVEAVGANIGNIANGEWTSDVISAENGFHNVWSRDDTNVDYPSSKEIIIERYATKNSKINITGKEGLISTRYSYNNKYYELCKQITYKFETDLNDFKDVLDYNEASGILTVKKDLNSKKELKIIGNSNLGFTYNIKLIIKPNIDLSFELLTKQGDLSIKDGRDAIYSDNDVVFNLQFTIHLSQGAFIIHTRPFHFEYGATEATIPSDYLKYNSINLVVNFPCDQLGEREVKIYTGNEDEGNFCRILKLYVYPNLELLKNTQSTDKITKEIEVGNNGDISILNDTDYQRIVGNSEIVSGVSVNFKKVENKETRFVDSLYLNGELIENDLFEINSLDSSIKLKNGKKLLGTYIANIDVLYGSVEIGVIEVTIKSNITPNTDNEYYSEMFGHYNGEECLILSSGNTYIIKGESSNGYIKLSSLFSGEVEIDLSQQKENVYVEKSSDPDTTTITVNDSLIKYYYTFAPKSKITLTLKNEFAEIKYPVLFSPLQNKFVTYSQNGEVEEEDLNKVNNDMGYLNDDYILNDYSIYDVYSSGNEINLFQNTTKTYGLSKSILSGFKNGVYQAKFYQALPDGTMSKYEYEHFNLGEFNESTGILTTSSSSEDKLVYMAIITNNTKVGIYRFKLKPDLVVHNFYPYSEGFEGNNEYNKDEEEHKKLKEYVYEKDGENLIIDFGESFAQKIPNSLSYENVHRVMLQKIHKGEDGEWYTNVENYTLKYKIDSIIRLNKDEPYTREDDFTGLFGVTIYPDGKLLINKEYAAFQDERVFDINVKVTTCFGEQEMGSSIYTISVNNQEKDKYFLKKCSVENSVDFNTTEETVEYNSKYNYSEIVLYKRTDDGVSNKANDVELKFHIYIEGKDIEDYLSIDKDNKTIAVQNGVELVTPLKVKILYYTIYGEILTTTLTYKSYIEVDYVRNGTLTFSSVTNIYELYADTKVNLNTVFSVKNLLDEESENIDIDNDFFKYRVKTDDDSKPWEDGILSFPQITKDSIIYDLEIKIELKNFDGNTYKDNYIKEIKLKVNPSVKTLTSEPLNYGDIYYQQEYTIEILTDDFGSNNHLIAYSSSEVLEQYNPSAIVTEATDYVEEVSINLETKTITLKFEKSPDENNKIVKITLTLEHKTSKLKINAYFKFTLKPDIIVTLNYPQPNEESKLEKESIYLDPNCISHTVEQGIWPEQIEKPLKFKISSSGYFGGKRVLFSNYREPENTINSTSLGERLKYSVTAISQNNISADRSAVVVSCVKDGERLINKEIENVPYDTDLYIIWRNTEPSNAREIITITILIDGVERGQYKLELCSDMTDIFTVDINNLYKDITGIKDVDAEIFYVENGETENLFSNTTALLSFTSRGQKTDNVTVSVYVDEAQEGNKAAEFVLDKTPNTYNVILLAQTDIKSDMSNIYFKTSITGDNVLSFKGNLDPDQDICSNFIMNGTCCLTFRASVKYLTYDLDYQYFSSNVEINGSNVKGFKITKDLEKNIETTDPVSVPITINDEEIGKYEYFLKYDFKVAKDYTDVNLVTMNAPEEIDLFKTFGITTLHGEEYCCKYFENIETEIRAKILMITNNDFNVNPTINNVLYIDPENLNICKEKFSNIKGLPGSNADKKWIALSPIWSLSSNNETEEQIVYNYLLSAYGAENNGNYGYILVTYSAKNSTASTYAIVKVKITAENYSITLSNGTNDDHNENLDSQPLNINYKGIKIDEITLARTGGNENDLIFIGNASGTNKAVGSEDDYLVSYVLCGDINKYMEISKKEGKLYLEQKEGKVAQFGDKTGYIKITDKYGYTINYYLLLKAQSDDALTIGDLVNTIGNERSYYTGTTICVVKAQYNEESDGALLGKGAILVNNFKETILDAEYDYNISYSIPELGFEEFNKKGEFKNECTLPFIIENEASVTLNVTITINKEEYEEDITLTTPIKLIKRFELKAMTGSNVYVREGINFNLFDFIVVEDKALIGKNVGDISISNKSKTLKVAEGFKDSEITIYAKNETGIEKRLTITVGKDHNGQEMVEPADGYYYHVLQLYDAFKPLNFENYTIELANAGTYDENDVSIENDLVVSVVTTKIVNEQEITIYVKNEKYEVPLKFKFNFDGQQSKSLLYEITKNIMSDDNISSGDKDTYIKDRIENIYNYQVSEGAISPEDLKILKNFIIYNDSLSLVIKGGRADMQFTVKVYDPSGEELLGSKVYKVTKNIEHYRYISISDVLSNCNLEDGELYKVEIVFVIETTRDKIRDFSEEISYCSVGEEQVTLKNPDYNGEDSTCTYTITINNFEINEMEIENLPVLNEESFGNTKIYETTKYYLVRYSNNNIIQSLQLNYNVTPKYAYLSNYTGKTDNTKYVYTNQYITKVNGNKKHYEIPFEVWSSSFNLLDGSHEILCSLNNGKDDLIFDINNDDHSSGSATLDEYFNIITSDIMQDDEYFSISVSVKVNNSNDKKVQIGVVQIQLVDDMLYVALTGEYLIKITPPGGEVAFQFPFNFDKNTKYISNILEESAEDGKIELNDDKTKIKIREIYYNIYECNYEVVTVLQNIYSAEYTSDANVKLKLGIAESESSIDKEIVLMVEAVNKSNKNIKYTSTLVILKIGYENLSYYITTNITTNITGETKKFGKDETGAYNIFIPFKDLFPDQTFVGADYNYLVDIISVNETGTDILYYSKAIGEGVEVGNFLFFKLEYVKENGDRGDIIVAVKHTSDKNKFCNIWGYPVDISQLNEDLGLKTAKNYVLSFIDAYDILGTSSEDEGCNFYILIENIEESPVPTHEYSLGYMKNYNSDHAFEVTDYARKIVPKSIISKYEGEGKMPIPVIGSNDVYIPSSITLNLPETDNNIPETGESMHYIGVYNSLIKDMKIFGIVTSSNEISFDISSYNEKKYVTVLLLDEYIKGRVDDGVLDYTDNSAEAYCLHKDEMNHIAYFIRSTITKDTAHTQYTLYEFSNKPILNGTSRRDLKEIAINNLAIVNVSSIININNFDETKYYAFKFSRGERNCYLNILGSELTTLNLETLVSSCFVENIGYDKYILEKQNIDSLSSSLLKTYALYDNAGKLLAVKCIDYQQIEETNFYETDANPLYISANVTASRAVEIIKDETTDRYTVNIDVTPHAMLCVSTYNNDQVKYEAIYLENVISYEYSFAQLSPDGVILFDIKNKSSKIVKVSSIIDNFDGTKYYSFKFSHGEINCYLNILGSELTALNLEELAINCFGESVGYDKYILEKQNITFTSNSLLKTYKLYDNAGKLLAVKCINYQQIGELNFYKADVNPLDISADVTASRAEEITEDETTDRYIVNIDVTPRAMICVSTYNNDQVKYEAIYLENVTSYEYSFDQLSPAGVISFDIKDESSEIVNVSSIIDNFNSNNYYAFKFSHGEINCYLNISGNELTALNLGTLAINCFVENIGYDKYILEKQNITFSSNSSSKTYKLYDNDDKLLAVKCIVYEQIEGTNSYKADVNPLDISVNVTASRAEEIIKSGDRYIVDINVTPHAMICVSTYNNDQVKYEAIYLENVTSYEYSFDQLSPAEVISFDIKDESSEMINISSIIDNFNSNNYYAFKFNHGETNCYLNILGSELTELDLGELASSCFGESIGEGKKYILEKQNSLVVDVSSIIDNFNSNNYYAFKFSRGERNCYLNISGNELTALNLETLVSSCFVENIGYDKYILEKQNITFSSNSSSKTYALYDDEDKLLAVKCIVYEQIEGTNSYKADVNPLDISAKNVTASRAVEITKGEDDLYTVDIPITQGTMIYVSINKNGEKTYMAIYLNATSYGYSFDQLESARVISFDINDTCFDDLSKTSTIRIIAESLDEDRNFELRDSENLCKEVTLYANETSVNVELDNFGETINGLTITEI